MNETSLLVLQKPPLVTEHEDVHYWPDHEYDDAADEDCLFCSILMQYLAGHPGAAPATLFEAELIRHAAGLHPSGGASTEDGIRGVGARYDWTPAKIAGFDALWPAFTVGVAATISGIPTNAPAGSPIRHWLPNYAKGHRIFALRLDTSERAWIMDPEGKADGTYKGEWCPKADLAAFASDPARTHTTSPIKRVPARKKVACAGGYLWSEPRTGATKKGSLPLGATASITAVVDGGSWNFSCGTTAKAGARWYRVTAINGSLLPNAQYAATGRF